MSHRRMNDHYAVEFDGPTDADVFREAAEWLAEQGANVCLSAVSYATAEDTRHSILSLYLE